MRQTQELLMALAKLQSGSPLSDLIREHGMMIAQSAGTADRVTESGNLASGAGEADVAASLISFTGEVNRRRVLTHLRKNNVLSKEIPLYKAMVPGSAPTIRDLIRIAAVKNDKKPEELTGSGSRPEAVMARFEASWLAVRGFGYPITMVAQALNKNHTTLLSGISRVDVLIARYPFKLDSLLNAADEADEEAAERHSNLICGLS